MANWKKVETDIDSGPWGLFKWFVIFILCLAVFFGVLGWVMKPASMAVDRIVTKQSFQYKEGMAQRAAILEANILEVDDAMMRNPEKREELMRTKKVLEAQLKAITINN